MASLGLRMTLVLAAPVVVFGLIGLSVLQLGTATFSSSSESEVVAAAIALAGVMIAQGVALASVVSAHLSAEHDRSVSDAETEQKRVNAISTALEMLSSDARPAPPSQVGAAIHSLILLGEPRLATTLVDEIWADGDPTGSDIAIKPSAALNIIGSILELGVSEESDHLQRVAVNGLSAKSRDYVDYYLERRPAWPRPFHAAWPADRYPNELRSEMCAAICNVLAEFTRRRKVLYSADVWLGMLYLCRVAELEIVRSAPQLPPSDAFARATATLHLFKTCGIAPFRFAGIDISLQRTDLDPLAAIFYGDEKWFRQLKDWTENPDTKVSFEGNETSSR